jgi:UDP-2,4-diacetamido-2,4,6-trideoxy-beta-L-altropyranose hydrolase
MIRAGSQSLVLRADAGAQIGTGHVMRCLALAQAWHDAGGTAHFAAAELPGGLAARLSAEGSALHRLEADPGSQEDVVQTIALAHRLGVTWVVEDGYHFGAGYQRAIKEAGLRLLAIDDYGHAGHYAADLVLNQNIYADESLYPSREPYTRLLLGTQYVLLRREFWSWRGWQREIPDVARKVLVTMGGSDPDNVTRKVMEALQQVDLDGLEVTVVTGASNPHYQELQTVAQESPHKTRVVRNVDNMPDLMAWADLAVSGAGSTCWEMAFMGLPNLALVLAENQEQVAEGLDANEAAINIGCASELSSLEIAHVLRDLANATGKRVTIPQRGRELVDGEGAGRVTTQMQKRSLRLEAAQMEDCDLLWEWANDPVVRAASFSPDPIRREEHVAWLTSKLADPNHILYLALVDTTVVGQIRYQLDGQDAVVSVSLVSEWRSRGYGSEVIWQASRQLLETMRANRIVAYIKPENMASAKAFARAGFRQSGATTVRGQRALCFVLERDPLI